MALVLSLFLALWANGVSAEPASSRSGASFAANRPATGSPLTVSVDPNHFSTFLLQDVTTSYAPLIVSGGTPPYTYATEFYTLPPGLTLSSSTGVISGASTTVTNVFNTFTIQVTDAVGAQGAGSFNIETIAAAQPLALTIPYPDEETDTSIASFLAPSNVTGGTPPYNYTIAPPLPAGLSIAPDSGYISGTVTAPLAATSYTITVTDAASGSSSGNFDLTVNKLAASTVIPSITLTQNQAVTPFTPVVASGGTAPFSYVADTDLPAGLVMSSSGVITGTPTATTPGPITVWVTVNDVFTPGQRTDQASSSFTVTVAGPFSTKVNAGDTVLQLTKNEGMLASPLTAYGGVLPYTYSVTPALPNGITISSTTGSITGVPTATAPNATYTVNVTDAVGNTGSTTFTALVNSPIVATPGVTSAALTENHAVVPFTPVTATGGTLPYEFTVAGVLLPAGISLNSQTGVFSGTPTATTPTNSTNDVIVFVLDANGSTGYANLHLVVNPPVAAAQAIASETLTQGVAASFTPVTASGGTGTLSFTVSPSLPAGLVMALNGQITGTPTAATAGAQGYTVTATDINGATATAGFTLTVNGPLAASTVPSFASTTLALNQAASFTPVTGSGGTTPYHFSIAPALPAGLSIATATGAITGTPTGLQTSSGFMVTVTDAVGATAWASFTLAVSNSVVANTAIASTSLTEGHAATPFIPVTASGGTGALSFSVAPALPAGLSIAPATGAISGTASAASPATTYTVTATDTKGATATASFSLTVNAALTASPAIPSTSVVLGKPVTGFTPVTGSGGTAPLIFAVAPSLPADLSLAAATGQITGTPRAIQAGSTYTVTVTDANGAAASADFALGVVAASSSVAVISSSGTSSFGQAVTFKATVSGTGGTPTGTVIFRDGGAALATESVSAGIASFTTADLAVGTHQIVASYSGDNSFANSTSSTLSQVVGADANPATIAGQVYTYQGTAGVAGIAKPDNSHFSAPAPAAVDLANGHLLVADSGNHRVQVLDTASLAVLATIGTPGVAGSDAAHLNQPSGVGLDPSAGRIFVADTGNDRVQVFDAKSFAYVATLGTTGAAGTDNVHFDAPASAFVNAAAHQLYIADSGNQRVQLFDSGSLAFLGTIGATGVAGSNHGELDQPLDAEFNPSANQIMVADSGNGRVELFDAATFAYVATLGGGQSPADNSFFGQPVTAAFDPVSNLVLIADAGLDDRVQVFDAMSYGYVLTLGTTGASGTQTTQFAGPAGIVADPAHKTLFIGDRQNDRIEVFSIAPTVDFAAVLPGSRSGVVGQPSTVFATLVNSGATPLAGCEVALPVSAPAGLTLDYQTTNPTSNALTGSPDAPATIPSNGSQTFLLTFQAASALSAPGLALDFDCAGAAPAAVVPGVDTVDLSMSSSATADIIALAATATQNGIVEMPVGGDGAFAVASDNVGAAAVVTVSADTGSATLPVVITLCQTNRSTGQCLVTPASNVSLTIAAGATPSFSVFVQATGAIPFAPATARVFLRFKDASGTVRGLTSVALETE
jgi:hypothetical protein